MPPVGFEPTISAGERPQAAHLLKSWVVCDLETSRIGAPYIYIYIYDISNLRVKDDQTETENVDRYVWKK